MEDGPGTTVVLDSLVEHDGLTDVDAVARMAHLAGQLGWSMRVRCSPRMLELLELAGLVGLPGLSVEVRREPEGREELGVDEALPRGDAPA